MKSKSQRAPTEKAKAPTQRRRFQIEKLEERVAPKKGGKGTHACTQNCADTGGGGSAY